MMKNPSVPLKDILYRQYLLGGAYLAYDPTTQHAPTGWEDADYHHKSEMIAKFYDYVQQNHEGNYAVPWSTGREKKTKKKKKPPHFFFGGGAFLFSYCGLICPVWYARRSVCRSAISSIIAAPRSVSRTRQLRACSSTVWETDSISRFSRSASRTFATV